MHIESDTVLPPLDNHWKWISDNGSAPHQMKLWSQLRYQVIHEQRVYILVLRERDGRLQAQERKMTP